MNRFSSAMTCIDGHRAWWVWPESSRSICSAVKTRWKRQPGRQGSIPQPSDKCREALLTVTRMSHSPLTTRQVCSDHRDCSQAKKALGLSLGQGQEQQGTWADRIIATAWLRHRRMLCTRSPGHARVRQQSLLRCSRPEEDNSVQHCWSRYQISVMALWALKDFNGPPFLGDSRLVTCCGGWSTCHLHKPHAVVYVHNHKKFFRLSVPNFTLHMKCYKAQTYHQNIIS